MKDVLICAFVLLIASNFPVLSYSHELILDSAKVTEVFLEERLLEEHSDFSRKQKQLQVLVQIPPVVCRTLCSVHAGSALWICISALCVQNHSSAMGCAFPRIHGLSLVHSLRDSQPHSRNAEQGSPAGRGGKHSSKLLSQAVVPSSRLVPGSSQCLR